MKYQADNIVTLSGLEHVRKHPGLYIKSPSEIGSQVQLLKECLDNATDEALACKYPNPIVDVIFFHTKTSYMISVIDSGRGIPLSKLNDVFTKLNTSGKWGEAYSASLGTFGQGVKCVSALSNQFIAITARPEGYGYLHVAKGVIQDSKSYKIGALKGQHGTVVLYQPDDTIFYGIDKFMTEGYPEVVKLITFFSTFTPSLTINVYLSNKLVNINKDPVELWNDMRNHVNCTQVTDIEKITREQYVRSVYSLTSPTEHMVPQLMKVMDHSDPEDLFGYDINLFMTKDLKQSGIVGAVNMTQIHDPDSYHISGCMDLIKEKLSFNIEIDELKAYFLNVYRLPISGSILVYFKGATFEGQTKNAFKDRTFLRLYTAHLKSQVNNIPEYTWELIYTYIQQDIVDKFTKYSNKELVSAKGLKGIHARLNNPKRYEGCKFNDNTMTELFITEGDSAGGAVAQQRDTNFQAVFKLTGKPANILEESNEMISDSKLIQDLMMVIGVTPYDRDLSKCNFRRIGIMTDADADGYHITALIVSNLYRINPLLISEGRVFLTNPPLYTMAIKNKMLFLRDSRALMDTKIESVYKNMFTIAITPIGKKDIIPVEGGAFRDFCYMITRVGDVIHHISKSLAVDSLIIENLVACIKYLEPMNTGMITKILDIDQTIYNKDNNTLILVIGGIEVTVPMTGLVKAIKAYILPEFELIQYSSYIFLFSTIGAETYKNTPMSLVQIYQIMQELDKLFTVSRYKGLGSLKPEDLDHICINPHTRSYVLITEVGDVKKIYEMLGVDTSARKLLNLVE